MITGRKPELMAPAGSYESLMAAIKAGADSVYFGLEQLNMRSQAANHFTTEDLETIVLRCKKHKVKSYLALNTILYTHDLALMRSLIDKAKDCGVDAVIVSDLAALMYAKKAGMTVHISTQANVTNIEAVQFYSDYADTIVLARELSLSQVKEITRENERRKITGPSGKMVRIEVFAHGALCMAVSGHCYISLHSHNASANRGACRQNCRRTYTVIDKEEGFSYDIENEFIMSAQDLCTIDFLDKVIDAGVAVLKLEGRGRAPEYVHEVASCYREAIDAIAEGTYTKEKILEWKQRMETVYNRGFWDGYYLGRKTGEWCDEDGSKATKKKIYLAKGMNYFRKSNVAEFQMEAQSLQVGDEIIITGPTTGVMQLKVEDLRVNGTETEQVNRGDIFSIPVPGRVRKSDKLYKLVKAK